MRKMIAAVALVIWTGAPAQAHVPEECVNLWHEAGADVQPVIRKGNEAMERAWAGIEDGWHNGRGDMLADTIFQLIPHITTLFETLTPAVDCVEAEK